MGRFLSICAMLAVAIVPLCAQFDTAEVLGTVRDKTGAVVPKAAVTLLNIDTGIAAKTTADDGGNYNFNDVKIGRYKVSAEAAGFSKQEATDIRLEVGARQRVDFTMAVGAVTETVEVSGAAAALETDTSEHAQVVSAAAVVELPLNGRNYADLALLATNVVKS